VGVGLSEERDIPLEIGYFAPAEIDCPVNTQDDQDTREDSEVDIQSQLSSFRLTAKDGKRSLSKMPNHAELTSGKKEGFHSGPHWATV